MRSHAIRFSPFRFRAPKSGNWLQSQSPADSNATASAVGMPTAFRMALLPYRDGFRLSRPTRSTFFFCRIPASGAELSSSPDTSRTGCEQTYLRTWINANRKSRQKISMKSVHSLSHCDGGHCQSNANQSPNCPAPPSSGRQLAPFGQSR